MRTQTIKLNLLDVTAFILERERERIHTYFTTCVGATEPMGENNSWLQKRTGVTPGWPLLTVSEGPEPKVHQWRRAMGVDWPPQRLTTPTAVPGMMGFKLSIFSIILFILRHECVTTTTTTTTCLFTKHPTFKIHKDINGNGRLGVWEPMIS